MMWEINKSTTNFIILAGVGIVTCICIVFFKGIYKKKVKLYFVCVCLTCVHSKESYGFIIFYRPHEFLFLFKVGS